MTKGGVSFTATAKNNGSAAAALKYSFSDKFISVSFTGTQVLPMCSSMV